MHTDIAERLAKETDTFWSSTPSPGMAVLVRRDGQELFSAYRGLADVLRRIPVRVETRFGIGSITKQFTAAAIMRLQEAGALNVDDPVSLYLPGLTGLSTVPRLRDLLAHTGGLRSALEVAMVTGYVGGAPTIDGVVEEISRRDDHLVPGTRWEYSNTGYYLLGHVVERASGMALVAYIERQLLQRHQRSDYQLTSPNAQCQSLGHVPRDGGFATVTPSSVALVFGSGGFYLSADALAGWQESLWGGQVLSEASLTLMGSGGKTADGTATQYGFGTYVARFQGYDEVSHDGNAAGFSTQAAWYPQARLSVVALLNSQTHVAERLTRRLTASILGIEALGGVPPGDEYNLPRDPYVGAYSYGSHRVAVREIHGQLTIETPTGRQAILSSVGNHLFTEAADSAMRYHFRVIDGVAQSFHVVRMGKDLGVADRLHEAAP